MNDSAGSTSRFWARVAPTITLAGLIITVIALIITVISIGLAISAGKDTRRISENISTRYIEQFPKNLLYISHALEQADKEILILTDVPGYGLYSKHESYMDYRNLLEKKNLQTNPKVNMKMVVLTPPLRKAIIKMQFGKNLADLQEKSEYESFRRWGGPKAKSITSIEDFDDLMVEFQNGALNDFLRFVQAREYEGNLPVYLWIVDDKVAVFSIPNLSPDNPQENAFLTGDPRLIKELTNVFNGYWSLAKSAASTTTGNQ